ncbi:hypothetical protein FOCG_04837 [Fusarium oxysporum f. sp. radicis-lycopersici 26381]|uniref:Uncharacterized protein n=4 Tax=Fusarium oxysporum TaxID=5507 RepID=W9IAG2_FUSOX|nr:hypothetical protein FOXG_20310 [Fusarium oxysporum f. sp. lycopersici 4287]EWY91627.1 hypothetical protein FOYG_08675 [Fusarium oxysporum NRRL 32931]EWZ38295.1 hypothetical protein FOZG_09973 [Fusarium oxysporum Fo47]EXK40366.1 hypothetical protein FOMG_07265 [Fusarium oxysporum f. sp. melonis 26406]EXL57759.1 hypothetical protein FOCG_04837 [Fusarium oxysporum f. sp. radicis-lycopersici 26381]KNB10144.1 hypothetical protein FOXG_20310 [Fusarium oxysporum f. sp. lycopersici 4287]
MSAKPVEALAPLSGPRPLCYKWNIPLKVPGIRGCSQ